MQLPLETHFLLPFTLLCSGVCLLQGCLLSTSRCKLDEWKAQRLLWYPGTLIVQENHRASLWTLHTGDHSGLEMGGTSFQNLWVCPLGEQAGEHKQAMLGALLDWSCGLWLRDTVGLMWSSREEAGTGTLTSVPGISCWCPSLVKPGGKETCVYSPRRPGSLVEIGSRPGEAPASCPAQ